MNKVVILGCENSHADAFIKLVKEQGLFSDIEFVGVYSHLREAAEKLCEKWGVPVMDSYDEAVGKVDGVVITARHGSNHYKYAKPYLASGVPMFIDKPITVTEEDALDFMRDIKANGIRVVGGSCCVFDPIVKDLKKKISSGELGKIYGGNLRAPVNMVNDYGNFFFYSQHLVEVMCEVFGYYPKSVKAYRNGNVLTIAVRYEEYDVSAVYIDGSNFYDVFVNASKSLEGGVLGIGGDLYREEFEEFHKLLHGGIGKTDLARFIAPVFILNAMNRSLESGNEETVNVIGEI